MKGTWLALVLVINGGCALYFGDGKPDDGSGDTGMEPEPGMDEDTGDTDDPATGNNGVPEPASMCAADVEFDLAMNWVSTTLPVTLDAEGTTFCVRLDSAAMTHPTYFEAHTAMEQGWPASFGVALFDSDGQLIEEGYDAMLNGMQNETYATVTLPIDEREIRYVKLHAWAKQGSQPTDLKLSFYQVID